ncbi:MAG: amidohydrolase [Candidatus Zipacnadales bacterium]
MTPELILTNGRVWTGRSLTPDAEALAIGAGRILAVGRAHPLEALAGPHTHRLDLQGRLVVPGFHDCHVHFAAGSLHLQRVDLRDARDEAEFGRRLREFDAHLPPGAWLLGGRWDHDLTFGGRLPTAALLDRYVPNRPAFLSRYDGHLALVNSLALQQANVTRETPDPPGGKIVRDAFQHPTGLLQDAAMDLVRQCIPEPTPEELVAAMSTGLQLAARQGLTSIHDMLGNGRDSVPAYQTLGARGALTLRVHLYWPLGAWEEALNFDQSPSPTVPLHLCGVKAFVDGSLGASTAWFHEPYAHEPDHCGLAVVPMDELTHRMCQADAAGLQLAVHAIGDRAVSELLDAWETLSATNGPRDRRLRMEHAQHIRPPDLPRFAALGVIASMQPYHAIDDARWAQQRIGAQRCAEAFVWRDLLDAGVRLAFGSDWPVAPLDVLAGIAAAVHRRPTDGSSPDGWYPRQAIAVAQALRAYTADAAFAVFADHQLGTLEPGKLADVVVLDRDITDPANQNLLSETNVVLTMVGGETVWSKEAE